MVIYSWKTKKTKEGFKYDVQEIKPLKNKNSKGYYADIKVIKTGLKPTRARAKGTAQKYVRFYNSKKKLIV